MQRAGHISIRAILGRAVVAVAGWAAVTVVGFLYGNALIGPSGTGRITRWDNTVAHRFAGLPTWLVDLAKVAPYALLAIAFVSFAWLMLTRARRGAFEIGDVVAPLAAAIGAYLTVLVLKITFARARPPASLAAVADSGYSFPSAHTTVGIALLVSAALVAAQRLTQRKSRVLLALAMPLSLAIPLSRLVLGVHWASDVIGGLLIGALWGGVSFRVCTKPMPRELRGWATRQKVAAASLAGVMVLAFTPVGWSYAHALTYPGSADVGTRTTDWMRREGAGSVVDRIENFWYARNPELVAKASDARHPFATEWPVGEGTNRPAKIHPLPLTAHLAHPLDSKTRRAFNGVWKGVAPVPAGPPAMATAFWEPDPNQAGVNVSALWVDHTRAMPRLVPGIREPGGAPWPWGSEIPTDQRSRVIAAFNGGFRLGDSHGGLMLDGRHSHQPLEIGSASLIIRRDGSADVAAWDQSDEADPSIRAVRQNLHLIVDQGRPVDGLRVSNKKVWGPWLIQLQHTWRSGVGIDSHGNLIYVAGNGLDIQTLAEALSQAGAVRGMQLDIHSKVVTCNLYHSNPSKADGVDATKLMPGMVRPATRYLQPDQRDFIAIITRNQPVAAA